MVQPSSVLRKLKAQGLVPDFAFTLALDEPKRELQFELKTLHARPST